MGKTGDERVSESKLASPSPPPAPKRPKWLADDTTPRAPEFVNIINKGLALLPAKPDDESYDDWMKKIENIIINPTWTFNTLTLGGTLFAQFINIANMFQKSYAGLSSTEKTLSAKKFYDLYATYALIARKDTYSHFYNEACNVLWALFHRDIEANGTVTDIYTVNTSKLLNTWDDYVAMNQAYADRYVSLIIDGKIDARTPIWIHDYQLMLVPKLIRNKLSKAGIKPPPIGFFLHIPVPTTAAFEKELAHIKTPTRQKKYINIITSILNGMLGADMCGFQTDEYRDKFIALAKSLKLSVDPEAKTISHDGRITRISTHPISINVDKYTTPNYTDEVKRITQFKGRGGKLILAIERSDPSKCIPAKLKAFKQHLESLGESISDLTPADLPSFLLIAVPTRADQPEYIAEVKIINDLVKEINDTFGRKSKAGEFLWKPVHAEHVRINSPEEMVAIYQEADVNIVTPKRDGMNLSAKECIAASAAKLATTSTDTATSSSSATEKPVVMIISTRMGADEQLGSKKLGDKGALSIAPVVKDPTSKSAPYIDNVNGLAIAIKQALDMPLTERKLRLTTMDRRIRAEDATWWVTRFKEDLLDVYTALEATKAATTVPTASIAASSLFPSPRPRVEPGALATTEKPPIAVVGGGDFTG